MGVYKSEIIVINAEILRLENLLSAEGSGSAEGVDTSPAEESGSAGGVDTSPSVLELLCDFQSAKSIREESESFRSISGVNLYGAAAAVKVELQIKFDDASYPAFLVFPNGVEWQLTRCTGLDGSRVDWNTFFANNRLRANQTKCRMERFCHDEIYLVLEAMGPYETYKGDDITPSVFAYLWYKPQNPR
jgi:hypothetical protein